MKYICYFYYIPEDVGYSISCINLPVGGSGWTQEEAMEDLRQQAVQMVRHYHSIGEPIPWRQIDLPFWASKHCIEVEWGPD